MKGIAIITGKAVFVVVLLMAVGGCAIMRGVRGCTRCDSDKDAVREWAAALGTTEEDMFAYLKNATDIHDRGKLNIVLKGKRPGWSAFYTQNDPSFDDLVRRYEGTERDRNIKVRQAMNHLAQHVGRVQGAYFQEDKDNRDVLNARVYGGMLRELANLRLKTEALRDPASPFLGDDDVEIWQLVRRFIATFEGETHRSADLKIAFDGIRFDDPLAVVERMRHETIIYVLLVKLPTHSALGELFKALEDELPRL